VPELPEVETVVRDIRPHLLGRRFVAVLAGRQELRRRWSRAWVPVLIGPRILEVSRRGKWIVVGLEKERYLLIHLGMTGQLTVVRAAQPAAPHTHLVWNLDRKEYQLRFRDIRRFGSATVLTGRERLDQFFADAKLGPEAFAVDAGYWRACLAGTRRCLKAVLLDQRALAGVGNIYADESLYEARLHPGRLGCELAPAEADRLRKAIVRVLNRAIDKRGSSIRDYVGGSGLRGAYQEEFAVYGRTGKPCLRCRRPVECVRLAGRSTHYCASCQPAGGSGSVGRNYLMRD
jgi:formamidopyrimidine-DNA glycosylase